MKKECSCGKASITYKLTGEDEYRANAVNTRIKPDYEGGKICVCTVCGDEYDTFDPCMVRSVINKNEK